MKVSLHNPWHQYLIGLTVNLLFAVLLYSCSASYPNTQLPDGHYKNNIWEASDVNSYVAPGTNYIQYGVFGEKTKPDHFRTIGYPALIALFNNAFRDHWVLMLQLFQCILFAGLYPLVTLLARKVVPDISQTTLSHVFLFSILSGVYFVRSVMILSDTLFLLLFILGLFLGIYAFSKKSPVYTVAYILCITIGGLVRPTLFLFPLLNLAIAFFVARQNNLSLKSTGGKAAFTTLLLILCCNLSTVRNYVNYSFLSPSSVAGRVAFDYAARKILLAAGKSDEYQKESKEIASANDVVEQTRLRKQNMVRAVVSYPVSTVLVMIKNAIAVFLDNHMVNNIANYFGYNWKNYSTAASSYTTGYNYKKSDFCFYATYLLMAVYFLIWLLFFSFTYSCLVTAKYEYIAIIACLLFMFILPGVITGDGGSRFRLPFEPFLMVFSIYRLSELHLYDSAKLQMQNLIRVLRQPVPSWGTGLLHFSLRRN